MAGNEQFMREVPSHFSWNLYRDSSKTFISLKQLLEEHLEQNPGQRTIETYLFMSYLFMSDFKDKEKDPRSALFYLQKAKDEILTTTEKDSPAQIGFLTVATANEAIIACMRSKRRQSQELEREARRLFSLQTEESQVYVKVVRAFALSRLGMSKYKEAEGLYREAVDKFRLTTSASVEPEKLYWLFALALMIGRYARYEAGPGNFTQAMDEEIELFERILHLDPTYALASAHLAQCYSLKKDHANAKYHSFNAIRLDPNNPSVLRIAGQALRKEKCFDEALMVYERCEIQGARNSYFYHHWGLVYRDKYHEQKNYHSNQWGRYTHRGRGSGRGRQNPNRGQYRGGGREQHYNSGRGRQNPNRGQHRGGLNGRVGRGQYQGSGGGAASQTGVSTSYPQDHGLLRQAIDYFTRALECDSQNVIARLDRARAYQLLNDFNQTHADYETLVTLQNVSILNLITIHYQYGLFLKKSNQLDEALDHLSSAVEYHRKITPAVALHFDGNNNQQSRKTDGDRAIACFTEIAEEMISMESPQQIIEGYKCLAKVNLIQGRYALARDEYKESLQIENNCDDIEALNGLVDSLLFLEDFGEAEQYIDSLAQLQDEDTDKLRVKSRLLEGDFEYNRGNHQRARSVFTKAVNMGSLEACKKLLHICRASDHGERIKWEFRAQCAAILHAYETAHPDDIQEFVDKALAISLDESSEEDEEVHDQESLPERVKSMIDVDHEVIGNVRKAQLKMEQSILEHNGMETIETLSTAVTVLSKVHNVLGHVMVSFKDKFYANCKNRCPYFYVRGRHNPMTYEEVKVEILRRLDGTRDNCKSNNKSYQWIDFESRFPDLLDFLVKVYLNSYSVYS